MLTRVKHALLPVYQNFEAGQLNTCYAAVAKQACTCRESLDNGEYAGAFWLCAQTCRALEPLHQLRAAQQLEMTVNRLYADCLGQLEAALATACSDFTPSLYEKVPTPASAWTRDCLRCHALQCARPHEAPHAQSSSLEWRACCEGHHVGRSLMICVQVMDLTLPAPRSRLLIN